MISSISKSSGLFPTAPAPDPDRRRAWFSFALPAIMAFILALVPIIGKAAIVPIFLILVPLVLWNAFRDTERALYLYVAWCWIDGVIRGLLNQDPVSIVARDLVLGIIVVGWGFQRLLNRGTDPLRCPPGTLLVALFTANCLLQFFNPYSLGIVQSIAGLKLHLSAIPLVFLGYDIIRRREQVRNLFVFLTLATLVIGLLSFVQYYEGSIWTWSHYPGTKEVISQRLHATQIGGTISASASFKPPGATGFGGGTGAFIALVFPLTLVLPLLSERLHFSKSAKICFAGILLAFSIIIFINGLRSALVIAAVGVISCCFLVGGLLRTRMIVAVLFCLVLATIAYTLSQGLSGGGVTDRFSSTISDPVTALHQDRKTFFDDAVFIVVHAPIGVGLGRVGAAAGRLGNSGKDLGFTAGSEAYLGSIMYETGIIGGILIASIALSYLALSYRVLNGLTNLDDRLMATAVTAVLLVISINFLATPILMGPPGSVLFWLLGGVSLRVFAPKAKTL